MVKGSSSSSSNSREQVVRAAPSLVLTEHSLYNDSEWDDFDVKQNNSRYAKLKSKLILKWSRFTFWRGLHEDEWDVHTVCTSPSIINTDGVNRTGSLISERGYRVTNESACSCLSGKMGGFFDSFNAPVFITSSVICFVFLVLFAAAPNLAQSAFPPIRDWISTYLGWFYIMCIDVILVFLITIAVSRYGDIKLGDDDSEPEFSFISWATMLFSAGMGIGLVFYGVAEPLLNFTSPPNRLYGANEQVAFERAVPLTLFNWGIHAWAAYSVLGLAICYFSARLKLPLAIRSALYPLLGSWTLRWPGHLIDVIAVMGTLFGLATSLGLGTIQLNAGLTMMNPDIKESFLTQLIIIFIITCIAMASVLSGTGKGMKWLSNFNTFCAALLCISIFFISRPGNCDGFDPVAEGRPCVPVAPMGSVLMNIEGVLQNFGNYFQIIFERSFRSGAYIASEKAWMSAWTIYYLGWFISWSPFVATFLAEISRGRTIREYVCCTLGLPLLVTVVWFTVFGLFAMNAQNFWVNPDQWPGLEAAGVSLEQWNNLSAQPIEKMLFILYYWNAEIGLISTATRGYLCVLTLVVLIIFFVSSSDSGCLVITILASGGKRNPPKWQKIFWVWNCALIALVLLMNGGAVALESLQAMVITMGLPLAVMLILITIGLYKTLRLDPYITHAPKPVYDDDADILQMFKKDIKVNNHRKRSAALDVASGWNVPKPRNSLFFDSPVIGKAMHDSLHENAYLSPPLINTFHIEDPPDTFKTTSLME